MKIANSVTNTINLKASDNQPNIFSQLIKRIYYAVRCGGQHDVFRQISTYNDICNLASINDYAFNNFKSHPAYKAVLEHVSYEQGLAYYECIKTDGYIDLNKDRDKIFCNDLFGNPTMYYYDGIGLCSPTTLRYMKVLSDIIDIFNFKNQISVVEIGVGYGGQCRIITEFLNVKKYTLVDITPALNLSRRYLENFIIDCELSFLSLNEISKINNTDLLLSNYAYSELNRMAQDSYNEKIIKHCRNGYITYNHITDQKFNTYTANEFASMLHTDCKILPEEPCTHPLNKIVVWKMD